MALVGSADVAYLSQRGTVRGMAPMSAALLLLLVGCKQGDALVVVTVTASPALIDVASLHVTASIGESASFEVPTQPPITISSATPFTFAIELPPRLSGDLSVTVEARGGDQAPLGLGTGTGTVTPGRRTDVSVAIGGEDLDAGAQDGGAPDGPGDLSGLDGADLNPPLTEPRLVAPPSSSTVTQKRPKLEWRLPVGLSGPMVDLCADRACAVSAGTATIDGSGLSAVPSADLSPGVKFWRVRAMSPAGMVTSRTWQFYVGARSASTMVNVGLGAVPDFDGDGHADVLAGAYRAPDSSANGSAGKAYLFLAPNGALSTSPLIFPSHDGTNGYFGQSVTSAGDVDGDGFADVMIAAPGAMNGLNQPNAGRVYLYRGGPAGVDVGAFVVLEANVGSYGGFGSALCAADIDHDGYSDLVVAASGAPVSGQRTGRIFIFPGRPAGPDPAQPIPVDGQHAMDGFGSALACADFNGDGYGDIAVGAYCAVASGGNCGNGAVYVLKGASPIATAAALELAPISGTDSAGSFGAALSAGDVNGDGYADLVVGAPGAATFTGAAYVFLGGVNGLSTTAARGWTGPAGQYGMFGTSVSATSDADGDGLADVVIGGSCAPGATFSTCGAGQAYVFLGASATLPTSPAATWTGPDGGRFGDSVAITGDVNGDGRAEILVGAPGAAITGGTNAGRVYVYPGSVSGSLSAATPTVIDGRDGATGGFGFSVF